GWSGATVNSNIVVTTGYYSDGIHAISNDGVASVASDIVETTGVGSVGIYAYGWRGANVYSDIVVTTNYFAPGIEAIAPDGVANGPSSDLGQTSGGRAPGIFAYGHYGANGHNVGEVKTWSYFSNGITAEAYDGDVNVNSNWVITHGYGSIGIKAYADFGDV